MRFSIAVERVLGRLGWDLTATGWRYVYTVEREGDMKKLVAAILKGEMI